MGETRPCDRDPRSKRCRDLIPLACLVPSSPPRVAPRTQLLANFMMDARFLDDLARRLAATMPAGLTALREDVEANFKAVLQSGLAKLDLVTRQEFEVQ